MDTKQKARLAQLNTKRWTTGITPKEQQELKKLKAQEGTDQGIGDATVEE